jgi:hypothetical protein
VSDFFVEIFRYFADPFFAFLKGRSVTPQIDFGNFMVGLGTLIVAGVSFYVARSTSKIQKRTIIASMREKWIEDLRREISECLHCISKMISDKSVSDFDHEAFEDVERHFSYIKMKINDREIFGQKLNLFLGDLIKQCWRVRKTRKQFEQKKIDTKTYQSEYNKIFKLRMKVLLTSRYIMKSEWDRLTDEINGVHFQGIRYKYRMYKSSKNFMIDLNRIDSENKTTESERVTQGT